MPVKSKCPPIQIPDVGIWDLLFHREHLPFQEDKKIFIDAVSDRSYNYAQVKAAATDFGEGLLSHWNWKKDDVLAVYTPNSIDMSAVVWGTLYAGGIVSPVNPAYTVEELAFQLKNSGAKALATQLPLIETAVKAARKVGLPKYRIFLLGDGEDPTSRYPHFTSLKSTPGRFSYGRVKVRNPSKELAFLAYSSGTTGLPKGVMLTHRNLVSNILMTVAGDHTMQSSEKVLAFLPLFHIYGLTRLLHWTFYSGLTCIVMENFDLEEWCKLIQQHKITYGYVVPPVILALSKHPAVDEYDLSSVRALTSAAAPLTKELIRTAYKRLGIPIKQGYGLSETSPSVHMQPLELWESAIGSVGTLLPNQTAKYVSHSGHEVPIGEAGELRVKGPNIFAGYWKNAEETKTALTPDGFLKTGDVGYQDKDGNFYITDRIKELIKYKGFQVAPAELEGILMSHDKINDVAVLGVQRDDLATEVPLACVVPSPGVPIGHELEKEITAFLASKVANHKKLRGGVKFVDEIPKSAAGKILRRILKEKYQQAPEMGTSKDKQGLGGWILVEQDEFSAQRPSKALQWSTDSVISKSLKLLTQRASEAWVELSLRM